MCFRTALCTLSVKTNWVIIAEAWQDWQIWLLRSAGSVMKHAYSHCKQLQTWAAAMRVGEQHKGRISHEILSICKSKEANLGATQQHGLHAGHYHSSQDLPVHSGMRCQ